jgi:hypothetical protein
MDDEFSLMSYSDDDFRQVTSESAVTIGEPVYNRVSVVGRIPSNVDFVVKSCTAMDDATLRTRTYDIIRDGCLSDLVEARELRDNLRGHSTSSVDFAFNGFTFESTSDTLYVECAIVLCALDTNNDFVNPTCGRDTEICALGSPYSLASALSIIPDGFITTTEATTETTDATTSTTDAATTSTTDATTSTTDAATTSTTDATTTSTTDATTSTTDAGTTSTTDTNTSTTFRLRTTSFMF